MKITETMIQSAILEFLSLIPDIYFFRSSSGAVKTSSGSYFKTGKPGCPDITLCYNGIFIGLEVKTKTGRQSPTQKQAEKDIKKAGGKYYIVRSVSDVKRLSENCFENY